MSATISLGELLRYPFMVHALEAGTLVAILAAVVGWYAVLAGQSFTAHTLSVMAFPGAAGAALVGLPATAGLYIATGAAAGALGTTARRSSRAGATAAIGTVQSVGLAAGFLFLSLNGSTLTDPESLLFGTFLGVTSGQVVGLAAITVAGLVVLAAIGRPLLFTWLDPELAQARGVPVGWLRLAFLGLLAVAVAGASQVTGALLVFALLIAPAAAAHRLTARPAAGLALSVVLGLGIVWLGLAVAYFSPLPPGFVISSLALLAVLIAYGIRR